MIIPIFEEPTFAVYDMEFYINEEPTEKEKQFKRILESIKQFERLPTLADMTAILEYEEKAVDYIYKLALTTLKNRDFEKDFADIYRAVNKADVYSEALKDGFMFIKYCALQNILNEITVIWDIKTFIRELAFKYNYYDREILQAITDSKSGIESIKDDLNEMKK